MPSHATQSGSPPDGSHALADAFRCGVPNRGKQTGFRYDYSVYAD